MKKQFRQRHYAAWRKIMQEYGLPLNTVLCGKMVDGRYVFTHRRGFKKVAGTFKTRKEALQ